VVIEERLAGEEVSLLAFTDGWTIKTMPPAQDHKRLLDGDRGPNTGGMGAYAPAGVCPPELVEELTRTVLQPAVDGLREEGCPFVGVLYAGLILTDQGPRVLEFNCRFGDPETQAILPLLESDLLEIAEACVEGRLHDLDIHWKSGAAACVVLASQGYPGKYPSGLPISGLERSWENAAVFHAGTRAEGERTLTAGGRVLGVTGWGESLPQALERAYQAAGAIRFEGMQFRKDIGARHKQDQRIGHQAAVVSGANVPSAYTDSGVDIDAGGRAVELMKSAARSTYGPEVLAGIGAFGGLFDAAGLQAMQAPVLAASTDGVGTKVMLAAQAGSYTSLGEDIVNHCINDILVQGARPLFFLDYIASAKLQPEAAAQVVSGMAAACREAGCALLGGETAEMPGVYQAGELDIAGTIVGAVERQAILPRGDLQAGDALIGLRSSGPHTNGYALIRKAFAGLPLDTVFPELGVTLAEALLRPHRSYLSLLKDILSDPRSPIKAMAHITGGGFIENIPRPLPDGLGAAIRLGSWPAPPVFKLIQERGGAPEAEMYRVFNMGIGMVVFVAREQVEGLQAALPEETWVIGELVQGPKKVSLV
jgi:phosphoribosylaminoimidazole synthetase